MTKGDTKDLIQSMYDAFNTRNIVAADDIFAPDFYSHPLKAGVEGVKKSWAAMLKAFPDARAEVLEVLVMERRLPVVPVFMEFQRWLMAPNQ